MAVIRDKGFIGYRRAFEGWDGDMRTKEDEPFDDPMYAHDLFPHMKKERMPHLEGDPHLESDPHPVEPVEGPLWDPRQHSPSSGRTGHERLGRGQNPLVRGLDASVGPRWALVAWSGWARRGNTPKLLVQPGGWHHMPGVYIEKFRQ